jgi:DNA-binding IclR family transcriptional regulator
MSDDDRYIIPSLDRTLSIMELLADEPEGKNITEIADELDISKNSVFRILRTLTSRGYVEEYKKLYRLGGKLFQLGNKAVGEYTLIEKALSYMRSLRDEIGETVLIGKRIGSSGIILEQVTSKFPIKVIVEVGFHFPLYCSAPGKVILAHLPQDEREVILGKMEYNKFTERTAGSRKELEVMLKGVLENGYGVDNEEDIVGVTCVACPIFNGRGYPIAAIWVTGPTSRLSEENFQTVGRTIGQYATHISATMGYVATSKVNSA